MDAQTTLYVTVLLEFLPSIIDLNLNPVDTKQWKVEIQSPFLNHDFQSLPATFTAKVRPGDSLAIALAPTDRTIPRQKYKVRYTNLELKDQNFNEEWIVPSTQPTAETTLQLETNRVSYTLPKKVSAIRSITSALWLPGHTYSNGTLTFDSAPPNALISISYLSHLTRTDVVYQPHVIKTLDPSLSLITDIHM